MPSSWPQPAVLTNLLPSSTVADGPGANDGKSSTAPSSYDHRVLALYKFVSPTFPKEYLPTLKTELDTVCRHHSARGTLLIAEEGINGTICYPFQQSKSTTTATDVNSNTKNEYDASRKKDKESADELLSFLQVKFGGSLRMRISVADRPIFARLKIKIKSEIVTMHWKGDERDSTMKGTIESCNRNDNGDNNHINGNKDESASSVPSSPPLCGPCCPTERVGEYVQPRDWNKLLLDPDTLVIDTRNEYEIDVGTFRNAINPHTQSFVEFPDWIKRNLVDGANNENGNNSINETEKNNAVKKTKKIAMFCESMECRYE
jgi:predicted sulfurtransferase